MGDKTSQKDWVETSTGVANSASTTKPANNASKGGYSPRDLTYPLADALQSRLSVDMVSGDIKKAVPLSFALATGAAIDFNMDVIDSFVNTTDGEAGVVVYLRGDAVLLMTYARSVKTLCVYLIDWSKFEKKWRLLSHPKKSRITNVVTNALPGIVAGWHIRGVGQTNRTIKSEWEAIDIDLLRKMIEDEHADQGADGGQAGHGTAGTPSND